MPPRRISTAPLLATAAEQRALLAQIDSRPELGAALANILGKPFPELTKQEKLASLRAFQRSGLALAPIEAGARLIRKILVEGEQVNSDPDLVERNEQLSKKLKKARRKIRELKSELAVLQDPPEELGHP